MRAGVSGVVCCWGGGGRPPDAHAGTYMRAGVMYVLLARGSEGVNPACMLAASTCQIQTLIVYFFA
jgi:hypothetical protein